MSKLKKLFGAGNQDDDEVMYGSGGSPASAKDYEKRFEEERAAAEAAKAEKAEKKQSESDSTPGQAVAGTAATAGTAGAGAAAVEEERKPSDVEKDTEKSEEPKKKGFLSKILPSKGDKEDKDVKAAEAEPTAHDGELGQGAVVAGAGGLGAAGVVGAAAYESNPHDEPRDGDLSKSTADTAGVGAAGAGAAGVGAAGVGAATHESNPRVDTGDDVSKSTYTERSYPLATGESREPTTTDDSHLGRDAAIAGVGAGAVGAGAYAATRHNDNDQVTPDTSAKDIQNPEQVDSASRLAPHVPGEFPTEDGGDPHVPGGFPASTEHPPQETSSGGLGTAATAVGAGAVAGAVAAGAGGAAASTGGSGDRQDGLKSTREHEHFFGRPPASPPASPPATQTEFAKPTPAEDHSGRTGAIAAATAATAGAGGVAAYEATRDKDAGAAAKSSVVPKHDQAQTKQDPPGEPQHGPVQSKHDTDQDKRDPGRDAALAAATAAAAGGAAGAGAYAATRDDDTQGDNRVSTDASGHQRLHKKSEDRQGEKKPGFISKLLHRDKSKKEKDADSSSESPSSPSSASRAAATAAAAGATSSSSPTAKPNNTGLPVGDDGLIHIVNEDAHPDAPSLVLRGDGTEILKDREEV